jgi:hypothetical protein
MARHWEGPDGPLLERAAEGPGVGTAEVFAGFCDAHLLACEQECCAVSANVIKNLLKSGALMLRLSVQGLHRHAYRGGDPLQPRDLFSRVDALSKQRFDLDRMAAAPARPTQNALLYQAAMVGMPFRPRTYNRQRPVFLTDAHACRTLNALPIVVDEVEQALLRRRTVGADHPLDQY